MDEKNARQRRNTIHGRYHQTFGELFAKSEEKMKFLEKPEKLVKPLKTLN